MSRTIPIEPDFRFTELEALIDKIPDEIDRASARKTIRDLTETDRRRKIINKHIVEALGDLRLQIKALVFDRDCLQDEVDRLRRDR